MDAHQPNSFFRKVLTLGSGTAIAHLLLFASTPILTRLYQPEAMGVYALFMSVASIFIALSSGRLEMGVVLPKADKEGLDVLHTSWMTHVLWSLFYYLIWGLLYAIQPDSLSSYFDYHLLALVPVFGGLQLLFESLKQWALRKEAFAMMSWSNLIKAIATLILQIGFALLFATTAWQLVLGMVLSLLLGNQWMWRLYRKSYKANEHSFSWKQYVNTIKTYKKFPLFTSPSILLNSLVLQLPVWVISSVSIAVTGLYNIAERILQAPLLLVGHSVGQVFYKNAQDLRADIPALKDLTWKVYRSLFYLMFILYFVLFIWGAPLFGWIFGEEWLFAGQIAALLAPQLIFNFTVSPISNLWYVFNRNQQGIYFQGLLLVGRLVIVALFFMQEQELPWLFLILGLFGACAYGILGWSFLRRVGVATKDFVLQIVLPLILIHVMLHLFLTI